MKSLPNSLGKYFFIEEIGRGCYSRIYKVHSSKDFRYYACKVIDRQIMVEKGLAQSVEQELRLHRILKHPNICQLVETLFDSNNIYIIMEYCDRGDLFSFITNEKTIPQVALQHIFTGIVRGLTYLHEKGLAHCDIKPENILVTDDYSSKLCDFGCCEDVYLLRKKYSGTIYYLAPEIIRKEPSDRRKWDIWSLGIVMYVVYSKKFPWHCNEEQDLLDEIINKHIMIPDEIPISVRIIMEKCLSQNPEERPSSTDLISLPWFKNFTSSTVKSSSQSNLSNQYVMKSIPPLYKSFLRNRKTMSYQLI